MKRNKTVTWVIIAIVIVVGIGVAIAAVTGKKTSTSSSSTMSSSSAVSTNSVTISNYMFSPADIKVKVGTTVTWSNKDPVNHTVTADTNSTDAPSSMDIAQGKSFSFTFKKAGTYTYHCFPHPYMHGSVVVTN